jgi:hypothetical protein
MEGFDDILLSVVVEEAQYVSPAVDAHALFALHALRQGGDEVRQFRMGGMDGHRARVP